jgi:hypothetical protein
MTFLKNGRRAASACVVAAAVTALVAPGAASAGVTPAKKSKGSVCVGDVAITGNGAAVEQNEQNAWLAQFNSAVNANPFSCKGVATVAYIKTSSGEGLNSWGAGGSLVVPTGGNDGFAADNAFIGTEEAPNSGQVVNIENQESTPGSVTKVVLNIPAAQEAINVIVHLPSGCTASSTNYPAPNGRLVLNNETLQALFAGTITNWTSITDGGDKFSGESCGTTPIQRVVRDDSAGTTNIVKKYFGLISASPAGIPAPYTGETWAEISEGAANTVWPAPAGGSAIIQSSATKKDSGEINTVAATASSIGYASLTDVRTTAAFVPAPSGTGGAGTSTFWVPIQDNGVKAKGAKYADPAVSGEVDSNPATNGANCAKTKYTNGAENVKFPPTFLYDDWSPVTTATKEKNYSICGITYILALSDYQAFPGGTAAEAQTVQDYANYVLSTAAEGGQTLLEALDYEPLPKALDKEAVTGIAGIG